jgi:RNA polymerase sigma-70 factor (ECF subfamily)
MRPAVNGRSRHQTATPARSYRANPPAVSRPGRGRLETVTEDPTNLERPCAGPEDDVLARLTYELVQEALDQLPVEQRECIVLRFLADQTIAETAKALGRTEGAAKQLQLRAARNLAKLMPEGIR